MNKMDLAERLAQQSHRTRADAADDINRLVFRLLKGLRHGVHPVSERKIRQELDSQPKSSPKTKTAREKA